MQGEREVGMGTWRDGGRNKGKEGWSTFVAGRRRDEEERGKGLMRDEEQLGRGR